MRVLKNGIICCGRVYVNCESEVGTIQLAGLKQLINKTGESFLRISYGFGV